MSIIGDAGTDYLYPRRDDLRPILETALDAVVVMKSDGIVADWNDRAAAVFGWSREEAVGRVMADLVIPERYREAHRKGLRRYLESGKGEVVGRRIEVSGLRKMVRNFSSNFPFHRFKIVRTFFLLVSCATSPSSRRCVSRGLSWGAACGGWLWARWPLPSLTRSSSPWQQLARMAMPGCGGLQEQHPTSRGRVTC